MQRQWIRLFVSVSVSRFFINESRFFWDIGYPTINESRFFWDINYPTMGTIGIINNLGQSIQDS